MGTCGFTCTVQNAECRNADAGQAESLKTPGLQLCWSLHGPVIYKQGYQVSNLLAVFLMTECVQWAGV